MLCDSTPNRSVVDQSIQHIGKEVTEFADRLAMQRDLTNPRYRTQLHIRLGFRQTGPPVLQAKDQDVTEPLLPPC